VPMLDSDAGSPAFLQNPRNPLLKAVTIRALLDGNLAKLSCKPLMPRIISGWPVILSEELYCSELAGWAKDRL
jgi:hypothetical protein